MRTVYGVLADQLGHASSGGRHWATPSADVMSVQRSEIPIDVEHSHVPVGSIVYLERDARGRLWAVGHISGSVEAAVRVRVGAETIAVPHHLYWSAERRGGADYGIALDWLSLTTAPAR